MIVRIDWESVWKEFDFWYKDLEEDLRCHECGMFGDDICWEDQANAIERFTEANTYVKEIAHD